MVAPGCRRGAGVVGAAGAAGYGLRRAGRPDLKWIVIAAEPITDVDTTASDMLQELDAWLNERHVSLVFAEMTDPVRAKIERYGLTRTIDPAHPAHFFPALDAAVNEFMRETRATWRPGAGS